MEQSPRKTGSSLTSQETSHILWNSKVHYHIRWIGHLSVSLARLFQSTPFHPILGSI
jgi:hypothetical protein